jgi:HK97 family phage major capsid protein
MSESYENKAASADEMAEAFDGFMRAFEEFKATNDERLEQIEQRVKRDVLTEEKLERLNRALDEVSLRAARPRLAGDAPVSLAAGQHKAAFEGYVRKGETGQLRRVEAKALSVGSDPDGGYLVPAEVERQVMTSLKQVSPIRAVAAIREVSGASYKKPFSVSGPGTGWVGESVARPETSSPTLAELTFPTMELYAMPAATSALLDDAAVNVDEWLAEEIRLAFAEQEGTAFVTGDGVNKPKGFLSYPKVDNAAWSWGNLGYVATGVAGDFAASDPSDNLIDLVYSLKAGYRANGSWCMNRASQAEIRKIKDGDGNYIWQPGESLGASPTLMHFPIIESEDMPDIATDAAAIAFGDFSRGYLIVDRIGLRVLRDPYSAKPYVLFYTTKRVGGGIQDFDAIKLLKFGVA